MFGELNTHLSTVKAGINTRDYEFAPLSNFIGRTIKVDGFFFTESKYGKLVVVVGNGYNINMPKRAVEQFEKIVSDSDMVKAVLDNKLVIKNIEAITSKNGNTIAYELADA